MSEWARLLLYFANMIITQMVEDLVLFDVHNHPKKIKDFPPTAELMIESALFWKLRELFDVH